MSAPILQESTRSTTCLIQRHIVLTQQPEQLTYPGTPNGYTGRVIESTSYYFLENIEPSAWPEIGLPPASFPKQR